MIASIAGMNWERRSSLQETLTVYDENGEVYFQYSGEINILNSGRNGEPVEVEVNMLMGLVQVFGNDLVIQYICDVLDIDYEEIKDQLPDNEAIKVKEVQNDLDKLIPDDEGGDTGEQITEGSATGTS